MRLPRSSVESTPTDYAWVHSARAVVDELVQLARRHVGRLAAVTISAPESVPTEQLARYLRGALSGAGGSTCDVTVQRGAGPMRIVSLEVER